MQTLQFGIWITMNCVLVATADPGKLNPILLVNTGTIMNVTGSYIFLQTWSLPPHPKLFSILSHFSNFHLEIHLVTIYVIQLNSVPVGDTNNEETNIVNRTENYFFKKNPTGWWLTTLLFTRHGLV